MPFRPGAVLSRDTSSEAEHLQVRAWRSLSTVDVARIVGSTSDRQWRDVLAIVLVQGSRLDRDYLSLMAARVGLTDLLDRALREAAPPAEE